MSRPTPMVVDMDGTRLPVPRRLYRPGHIAAVVVKFGDKSYPIILSTHRDWNAASRKANRVIMREGVDSCDVALIV
ncbi:hypothetical protein LCGC14_2343300 [marine sediment metagenome]|uniref:Uncharacterized protein n=1 Tax=marine sediment metagenome TaxID=412755 RepID=A0A0F9F6G1_9ZZZZ